MKRDRKAMREALLKRTQESHERREDSGRFGSIFKDIPGLQMWKCGAGEHVVDIIPFVAGENNPTEKKGDIAYVLEAWVHYGVGVNEDAFICPARTFNKDCPICEYRKQLREEDSEENEELIKSLNPKRRAIYNIVCLDNEKEEAKGVQVWDVAHWFMERHLTPLAKKPKSGGFVLFADPDLGRSISFERKGTGATNTEFLGHKFVDREGSISDEILDAAYCLDEIVAVPEYDELYAAFWGSKGKKEAEEEPEEAEGPEEPEEPEEEVKKPEEEVKKPTIAQRRKQREERKQRKQIPSANKCPGGGQFGVDLDTLEYCDDCPLWEECAKRADELADDDIPF
jgi:hypothetical protein